MIFVDSNIWIFLSIENYPEHPIARVKIREIREGGIATNVVVISEVFHKLSVLLDRSQALLRVTKILDSTDVVYIPTDSQTLRKALQLAKDRQVRINDAIIAEQALDVGASVLTDNAKDFRKVPSLKVMLLR